MRKALDVVFTLALALFFMFALVITCSMMVQATRTHYNTILKVEK